jgi:hypothetical protein
MRTREQIDKASYDTSEGNQRDLILEVLLDIRDELIELNRVEITGEQIPIKLKI